MKIRHLINPVAVREGSDFAAAQSITFESLRRAKAYVAPRVDVEIAAVGYLEDMLITPQDFVQCTPLTRSIRDIEGFQEQKKLPFLSDLFRPVSGLGDASLCIFSNIDIGVMPYFYETVAKLAETGYDAFAINRTTVPKLWNSPADLAEIYAARGKSHEGIDCFGFKPAHAINYIFAKSCIGVGPVGQLVAFNQFTFAERFCWLRDSHLTFHLGDDKAWLSPEMAPLHAHNFGELSSVASLLTNSIEARHNEHKFRLLKAAEEHAKKSARAIREFHSCSKLSPALALSEVPKHMLADLADKDPWADRSIPTRLGTWDQLRRRLHWRRT